MRVYLVKQALLMHFHQPTMEIRFKLATEPAVKRTIAVVAGMLITYISTHTATTYDLRPLFY
jgi:hypothetical protein